MLWPLPLYCAQVQLPMPRFHLSLWLSMAKFALLPMWHAGYASNQYPPRAPLHKFLTERVCKYPHILTCVYTSTRKSMQKSLLLFTVETGL